MAKLRLMQLSWHRDELSHMRSAYARESLQLAEKMKALVELGQDISCLSNLIQNAEARGVPALPINWREQQFKGRR